MRSACSSSPSRTSRESTVGGATVSLSDFGVLAAAIAAAAALPAHGERLRGSRWIWVTTVAFLAFIVAASLYPIASDSAYAWRTHLVTAAKYVEYAVLAPAVVLLVRDARALTRLLGTAAVWALLAGIVATLQYVGVDILGAWPSGWRQPSFVGISELGTLGGAALAIGFVGLLRPGTVERRLGLAALVGGTLCVVLSGGIADELGVVLAAVASRAARLDRGRRARGGAPPSSARSPSSAASACSGCAHGDLTQYARYIGLAKADSSTNTNTQTFAQRELMYYLGLRVWLDKPILGAGWQSIREQQVYGPFLADAHRRYSNQPEQAFPHAADPDRQYGIDNAYIQALAELGIVGFLLFLALLGVRPRLRRETGAAGSARRGAACARRRAVAARRDGNLGGAGPRRRRVVRRALVVRARARRLGRQAARPERTPFSRSPAPGSVTVTAVAKALVTGGAGFIGSNLARALIERGDSVRVLDNFSTGNRANLAGVDVEVVEGELRSYERVHNAVRGIDVVYHLGALGSVPRSVQDPLTSNAVNVEGTLNVLLAARDSGVRRVVFASSSSIYGGRASLPVTEEMPPDPISPYGVAKLAAERYCIAFSRVYEGLETVVLRYFNVFGPRQSPFSQYAAMVPLFLTAVMRGEPITIDGDGEQSRGFTYVSSAVDATLRAADVAEANGRIFNVSGATPSTVNEVADAIGRILGKPVERVYGPARVGDIRASWADVSAARATLGWEPTVALDEGLRLTAESLA